MEPRSLVTADGAAIAARLFRPPAGRAPCASVLIGNAMGVPQSFYAPFARWLAGQGFVVATFDYRGTGESRRPGGSMRAVDADLHDWAHDTDTAIAMLLAEVPAGAPLHVVGHSLGAQLPGMLAHRDRITSVLGVAAGSGYWRDTAPALRWIGLPFWYAIQPLATWIAGYYPGRRLRQIGDLPRGVIWQWRRWCLHPRYHVGAEGPAFAARFAAARFPFVILSMADDEMMTPRGSQVLSDAYPNAPRRIERIAPADVRAARIGHFGFFREQFAATLWPRAAALLAGHAAPPTGSPA